MVNVNDRVRISIDTEYDAPQYTTEFIFWDGSLLGGKLGTVTEVLSEGPVFDLYGELFFVHIDGLDTDGSEPGRPEWLFPAAELEVVDV